MSEDRGAHDADDRAVLAAAQARLVAALVAGGEPPPGFDRERLEITMRALARKRAGEVARVWPRLAAAFPGRWHETFAVWAAGRAPAGGWRDGFDFARSHRDALPPAAAVELTMAEAVWSVAGPDRIRRRGVTVRRVPGGVVVHAFGRLRLIRRG